MIIFLCVLDPSCLAMMRSMGLALVMARILLRVLSDIFSWALILLKRTWAFQSLIESLLTSVFKGFHELLLTAPILLTDLKSAKDKLLCKLMLDKNVLSADGEFSSVAAICHSLWIAVENRAPSFLLSFLCIYYREEVNAFFRPVTFTHVGWTGWDDQLWTKLFLFDV